MGSMSEIKILTVDDDVNVCQLLALYLSKDNYSTDMANNGLVALEKIKNDNIGLVLLDIMMPNKDGIETLREIRRFSNVPIIMLTSRSEAIDKITALDAGADDYITKPFEPQELMSRIRAVLRRYNPSLDVHRDFVLGNLTISLVNYRVKVDDREIDMPPKEIELLYFLATHASRVFKRQELLEKIWGADYECDPRTIDVHMKRIREKLGDSNGWRLVTVWGVGYKFEA